MTEQVLELVQALGGAGQDEEALRTLCAAACQALDRRLKDGLTAEDCRGAYPLAAAWRQAGGKCMSVPGKMRHTAGSGRRNAVRSCRKGGSGRQGNADSVRKNWKMKNSFAWTGKFPVSCWIRRWAGSRKKQRLKKCGMISMKLR